MASSQSDVLCLAHAGQQRRTSHSTVFPVQVRAGFASPRWSQGRPLSRTNATQARHSRPYDRAGLLGKPCQDTAVPCDTLLPDSNTSNAYFKVIISQLCRPPLS